MKDMTPAGDLATILLSQEPSLDAAREVLRESGIEGEEATDFIYDTVCQINRDSFFPLHKVELLLAEGCDMACSYCFESAILDPGLKRRRVMKDEIIERAIGLLFDHVSGEEEVGMTLFGGEPTLNFSGLRLAVDLFEVEVAKRGVSSFINMTTNGLHLTQEMVEYLADHRVRVLFSIDGDRETHDRYRKDKKLQGTYDKVIANMKMMKRRQPWIGAKITVMPSEAARLFENVQALVAEGVNQFVIGAASGVEWSEAENAAYLEEWQRLGQWMREAQPKGVRISDFEEEEVKPEGPQFGCGAARGTIAVNAAGEVAGCSKIISLDGQKTIGKLGDVWHGLYCIRERADMAGCGRLKANCEAAGIAETYHGGCFATNYEATGDLYQPNLEDFSMAQRREGVTREVVSPG
ncbi:MAG: radical SAM protein [Rhodobacteraceae bacterium]|nr:radical SAM protein [Paracoccaceae bacterium]